MYGMVRKKKAAMFLCVLSAFALWSTAAGAVTGVSPKALVPVGHTVGIRLLSDGVLVVGLSTLDATENTASPAKEAGMKAGDLILKINGAGVQSAEHLQTLVQASDGEEMDVQIRRDGKLCQLPVKAAKGDDGVYRLGAWIRDSVAGIGTVTFYDPEEGVIGALGHGITDSDTAQLLPLASGSLLASTVKAVKRGESGAPGELRGDFDLSADLGTLFANTDCGIFAEAERCALAETQNALPVAEKEEVKPGKAVILSNIAGDTVQEYAVEIEKVCVSAGTRNMILRVTDPQLLQATGGIVQGMSGSPILQQGKIVGAVTHVLVNDPTCGYGIFIGNMLSAAYGAENEKAS